jgi:hypothetical protein
MLSKYSAEEILNGDILRVFMFFLRRSYKCLKSALKQATTAPPHIRCTMHKHPFISFNNEKHFQ